MRRIDILQRLSKLQEVYEIANPENRKTIDEERKVLGALLKNPRREKKIKELIRKGSQCTYDDIEYLLSQEYTKNQVAKIVGMGINQFYDYLKRYEGVIQMKKNVGQGNIAEAKRLLQETDKSVPVIAKETGAKEATVYYHAKRIRDTKQPQAIKISTAKKDKTVPQSAYNKLVQDYESSEKQRIEIKNMLQELKEKYKALDNQNMKHVIDYEDLRHNYEALERDYNAVAEEIKKKHTEFNKLQEIHDNTVKSHHRLLEKYQVLKEKSVSHNIEAKYEQVKDAHHHLLQYIFKLQRLEGTKV